MLAWETVIICEVCDLNRAWQRDTCFLQREAHQKTVLFTV